MDKRWMSEPRTSEAYLKGCQNFLDFAFANAARGNEILCPCIDCHNFFWFDRKTVYEHLVCRGMHPNYKVFHYHGEDNFSSSDHGDVQFCDNDDATNMFDDIEEGLLNDAFGGGKNGPDEKTKKFFTLLNKAQEELYPDCKNFSKLSCTIRLYLLKCLHGWSDTSFDSLLSTLLEMFPFAKIPKSFAEARKMIRDLGLDYEKIDACPNDCILYRKEYKDIESCPKCSASRWKHAGYADENEEEQEIPVGTTPKKIPAKVLRYFPLIPRLQRLFMSSKTAKYMRWYHEKRNQDGKMRHPSDGEAWKDFDARYPNFSSSYNNVRLGMSSDGVSPFRTMSSTHSTWPVMMICYNLPHWMCLKPEYFMLTLIIPGKYAPGNDIDVYLQPLIEELKTLWTDGVETYDASTDSMFTMRAALMWTISDLPGLSTLSGQTSKGTLGCPCCNFETCSLYLYNSRKMVYMAHRRFLDPDHKWRLDKNGFDGTVETRSPPKLLTGSHIVELLEDFENDFGKGRKKKKIDGPFKKRSILFDLPYWETNKLRHCLDVMHIEKNIFDSVVGTLLEMASKSKDHLKARLDLRDLGIKEALHPKAGEGGRVTVLPKACYSLTAEEKKTFCSVLKGVKLPDGLASDVSNCVNVAEKKLYGYKSHDAHVILHYILQVLVSVTSPKEVAVPLIRLGAFFKSLCGKVIIPEELDTLQSSIVEILCQFERIFPPSFFDIMVHLPVHLTHELRLGGPVQFRWMYSTERYLCKLKGYVRNRRYPEASMAEGYLAEEALTFCSRYMNENVDTRFNRETRNFAAGNEEDMAQKLFPFAGRPLGVRKNGKGELIEMEERLLARAHRYVLFNCDELEEYIDEHAGLMNNNHRKRKYSRAQDHSRDFGEWMKKRAAGNEVPDYVKHLAYGPNSVVQKFYGYIINGYRFHTRDRERLRRTQNCGVTVKALTPSFASTKDQNPVMGCVTYYGVVEDIVQLNYSGHYRIVLFRCNWFRSEVNNYGQTLVDFSSRVSRDDPFVLATQVQQVFYVRDPRSVNLYFAMKVVPRDYCDGYEVAEDAEDETTTEHVASELNEVCGFEEMHEVELARKGLKGKTINIPFSEIDESFHDEL